jgi:hypothetical protein
MGFQKNNTRSRFEKIDFLERRFPQTVALKTSVKIRNLNAVLDNLNVLKTTIRMRIISIIYKKKIFFEFQS